MKSLPVKTVLQSNCPKDSDSYEKYVEALAQSGIEPVTVRETYEFESGGVKYSVDPPAKEVYDSDPSNNSSLIVTASCAERSVLFAGDAESERIDEYLKKGASDCDVIKIPHHGRWDKMLEALLAATTPEYAIITSSDEEPEDERVITLLEERGVEVFLTREMYVTVTGGAESISVAYGDK